jgi:hypothetical protein
MTSRAQSKKGRNDLPCIKLINHIAALCFIHTFLGTGLVTLCDVIFQDMQI